jgi:large subunit ribosomal protein L25
LDIDVTALTLGKSLKVGALHFEGLEIVTSKEVVVCAVRMTRAARSASSEATDEENNSSEE